MESKGLQRVEIKSTDRGEVTAVFSTFDVIDKDGDVTSPGAFTEGEEVLISSYQHTSWGGALPVGKGSIRTTRSEAILEGQFFLDTTQGRDTFEVVKQLGAKQEWSYGYDVMDSEPGVFDGQNVQYLKRLKVHEVSPVLIGAGVNTRTLGTKGFKGDPLAAIIAGRASVSEYKSAIRPHETPTTVKTWDGREADRALTDAGATIVDLRAVHAWCDPSGDPEAKSSYRFAHHAGPGEPANLRACLIGIGQLNGPKGAGITDTDRRGVYNHLAAHLADGDIEAPAMRGGSGIVKQNDELAVVLADLASVRERAWETRTARAAKGKQLGSATVLFLEWISDEMRDLKALLDSPQEDLAREYVRFLAQSQAR